MDDPTRLHGDFSELFQEIDDYVDKGEEGAAISFERTHVDEARQGVCANLEEVLDPPLA